MASTGPWDTADNLLDGDEYGSPGGNFLAFFRSKISFTEQDGDVVSIAIKGAGVMQLTDRRVPTK